MKYLSIIGKKYSKDFFASALRFDYFLFIMNKLMLFCAALCCIAGVNLFWGCKDTFEQPNTDDIVFPDTGISYGKQVQPLFFRSCVFSGCHAQDTKAGGLSLESYADLTSASPPVVFLGDTLRSPLLWRIEGTHGVRRMPPPPQNPLNANQVKGISRWILEGARPE